MENYDSVGEMTILLILLLSVIAAILGRCGGAGDEGRKAFPYLPKWLFNTKARDAGVPICTVLAFFALGLYQNLLWWELLFASIAVIVLMLGALSTYLDSIFKVDQLWVSGLLCGIALFPYAFLTGSWIAFGVRSILLAILWGGLNVIINNNKIKYSDWIEELLRYLFVVATLPIMLF